MGQAPSSAHAGAFYFPSQTETFAAGEVKQVKQ